jgi:hypothetical protein
MNYTIPGGEALKIWRTPVDRNRAAALRSNPVDLFGGCVPVYGIIPVVMILSCDVFQNPNDPVFIGNTTLMTNFSTIKCWTSFTLDTTAQPQLILQQNERPGDYTTDNALKDYITIPTSAPGTKSFFLFQDTDEPTADWGGIFSCYYIDAPLY